MKTKEKVLWLAVLAALAANIWLPRHLQQKYSWERDLSQRYAADFDKSAAEVKDYIRKYIPDVTDAQIEEWTSSGKLESMQIGRQTRYFHNAGPNLFRIVPSLKAIKDSVDGGNSPDLSKSGTRLDGHEAIDAVTIPAIMEEVSGKLAAGEDPATACLALPKRMRVRFSLTVPVNTLKSGKTLRCWLPFPRKDVARQTEVRFIEAGVDSTAYPQDRIVFSDPSCAHSSLYMEAKTDRYHDVTFYEVFEDVSRGEWHPLENAVILHRIRPLQGIHLGKGETCHLHGQDQVPGRLADARDNRPLPAGEGYLHLGGRLPMGKRQGVLDDREHT